MPDANYKQLGFVGAILLIIVLAGTLYTSDYRTLLRENPDAMFIFIEYEQDNKIEFITRGIDWETKEGFLRWKYAIDKFTLYSNSRIGLKEDWLVYYYKTYGIDEWVRLERKPSKIKLYYNSNENSITIVKETPYYESKSRSGTGGTLIQQATITDISTFEHFPENYMVTWVPEGRRTTSDMHLVWRVQDFVALPENIEGIHTDGEGLDFGLNMKVTWKDAMDQFDYYVLDNVNEKLEVYFKPQKGVQTFNVRAFDPTSTVTLYLNGSSVDRDIEYGEGVNLTAVVDPAGLQVCLSCSHPNLGDNFTCGTTSVEYTWTAQGGIRTFNDSAASKNYSFTEAGEQTAYLNQIRNDSEFLVTTASITGYNTSNQYPKGVKIDIGGDGINNTVTSGELRGTETYLFEFNDSTTTTTFEYNDSKTNILYLHLPKDINVSTATLNVTGVGNDYQGFDYVIPETYFFNYGFATAKRRDGTERYYSFGGKIGSGDYSDYLNLTWTWNVDAEDITLLGLSHQSSTDIGSGANILAPDNQVDSYNGFFVIGGTDGEGSPTYYNTNRFYRYYPVSGWTTYTAMPVAANDRIGEIDQTNDLIYQFGGQNTSTYAMKAAHRYNITSNTWSQLADMPYGKSGGWAEWYNSTYIIVWGGYGSGASTEPNTFLYDTIGDAWTDVGSSAHLYTYHNSGFKLNGEIYSMGGASGGYTDAIYRYDKTAEDWIEMQIELPYYHHYAGDCDEYLGRAYCMSSGGSGYGWIIHTIYVLPNEPFLQVGNYINNTWNHADDLTGTENVGDFATETNEYLVDCTATDGYCDMPLYLFNLRTGNLTADAVNVTTELGALDLNISSMTCATDYCNETVNVWSDQNGTVELSNINISYKGTSNINITANSVGGTDPNRWNESWYNVKEINLSGTGTELPNYQVGLNITYDGDMQADFDDLRFVDTDDITEIDFWLEEKIDSSWAYVWVEVPTIAASGNTTIYMYYNNSAASSASNGTNTFDFYDDFEDGSVDTDLWSTSGSISEAGGSLIVPRADSTWVRSKANFTLNYSGGILFTTTIQKSNFGHVTWDSSGVGLIENDTTSDSIYIRGYYGTDCASPVPRSNAYNESVSQGTKCFTGEDIKDGAFKEYLFYILENEQNIKLASTWNNWTLPFTNNISTGYYLQFSAYSAAFGTTQNITEVRLQKYTSPEPVITFGSEEILYYDSASDTQWATVYYSKYERALPYTWTTSLFFLPTSNNSKNVTAFGQTMNTPMVNITGAAQDKGFLVAVVLNSSWSCLNITVSNTSTKTDGLLTNSAYQQICNITTVTGNCGNWGWADLFSCNATANKYIQPDLKWKSCCNTCMSCW